METTATRSGHAVLRCNLDETMLPRGFGDHKGVILKKRLRGQQKIVSSKNSERGSLTFVAIIGDNATVQPRLPQVLIGNEHILRVQDLQEIQQDLPPNVYVIRRKTGWVDHILFAQILEWLRKDVSDFDPDMEIILLVDASPVHTHNLVLKTAKRQRIRLCFVPALCTWLLQPCDTHLFRKFKAQLAKLFRHFRVQHGVTVVQMTALVKMIVTLIRTVVQGTKWDSAFDHNGYGHSQQLVSQRVLCNLVSGVTHLVGHSFPVAEDIERMLPAKRKIDYLMLQFFALNSMPRPKLDIAKSSVAAELMPPAPADINPDRDHDESGAMTHVELQHIWAHRLRQLPSRVTDTQSSQDSLRVPLSLPPHPVPAHSRQEPCPSLMMQHQPRPASQGPPAWRQGRVHSPKPLAMARPQTGMP